MISEKDLKVRLVEWADEYRHDDGGPGWSNKNLLDTLIKHKGFVPNAGGYVPIATHTAGDEVEAAVMAMEKRGMFKPGRVVRCEYFMAHSPVDLKLEKLRALGLPMSKAGFYQYLGLAHAFLAGALAPIPRRKPCV